MAAMLSTPSSRPCRRDRAACTSSGERFRLTDAEVRRTFLRDSAYKWLWRTEVVTDVYGRHPGPTHLLRYEDLLADPSREVKGILRLLRAPGCGSANR